MDSNNYPVKFIITLVSGSSSNNYVKKKIYIQSLEVII